MCRACGDPRGGRRCPASKSNSATSRARAANNRNFRRELAAATAAQFGPKMGRRVLSSEFSDMPALVEALGVDVELFASDMPGTTPQARPVSPDAKKLAKDIAAKRADAEKLAEAQEERKAAEKAAAEAKAEAAAKEQSAPVEESEAVEEPTSSLSVEDRARLEELEIQRRRLERAADNAMVRGRESLAGRYEAELEGVYAEIDELEGAASGSTSPAPEPTPEPTDKSVEARNEMSANADTVSSIVTRVYAENEEDLEEDLRDTLTRMVAADKGPDASEESREILNASLREATRALDTTGGYGTGTQGLNQRDRGALASALGTSDGALTSADVLLNRDALEADLQGRLSEALTGASTADAADDDGVRDGLANLEKRAKGIRKITQVREAANEVLSDYEGAAIGDVFGKITGAGTSRIRSGHSDAAWDKESLEVAISTARKELDKPEGSRNLDNLTASPAAQSREISAREGNFGFDNDRHILDRRVAPIPAGAIPKDAARDYFHEILDYDLVIDDDDFDTFVPTDTELGTIISNSYDIFEENSGVDEADASNPVEAAAAKANHREFLRLVDSARRDPSTWRDMVAFASSPTTYGADPESLTEDQLLNDQAPDPNQLNLF